MNTPTFYETVEGLTKQFPNTYYYSQWHGQPIDTESELQTAQSGTTDLWPWVSSLDPSPDTVV